MASPNWEALRRWVRERMASAPGGHGWDHVERVERMALRLAREVGAQEEIVRAAALLHDVCREEEQRTGRDHSQGAARLARERLPAWGFEPEAVEAIARCIEEHRFQRGRGASSLEAQVLSDADKLDALGAFGILRVFTYAGAHGRPLEASLQHFHEKLLRLEERLYTEPARRLARRRTERLRLFLAWLEEEAAEGLKGE